MTTKQTIQSIRGIIALHGFFSVADVEANSSPVISSLWHSALLAEAFYEGGVEANLYSGDNLVDEDFIEYENLPTDTLDDILSLAQDWEAICIKAQSRCED